MLLYTDYALSNCLPYGHGYSILLYSAQTVPCDTFYVLAAHT